MAQTIFLLSMPDEDSAALPLVQGVRSLAVNLVSTLNPADDDDAATIRAAGITALNSIWPLTKAATDFGNDPPQPFPPDYLDRATITKLAASVTTPAAPLANNGDAIAFAGRGIKSYAA
jgi:hypothetical protein